MTDPHHPLFGQQLQLLSLACSRGPAFIAAALPDGRRRLVRRAATDLERPLTPPATLPRISARTLLPLARHVRSMLASSTEEVFHANPPPPSLSAPSKAAISLSASAAMDGTSGIGTDATGPADRPAAAARLGRGGTPC